MKFGAHNISDESCYEILMEIHQSLENKLIDNKFEKKQERNLAIKYLHDLGQILPLFRKIIIVNRMFDSIQ